MFDFLSHSCTLALLHSCTLGLLTHTRVLSSFFVPISFFFSDSFSFYVRETRVGNHQVLVCA